MTFFLEFVDDDGKVVVPHFQHNRVLGVGEKFRMATGITYEVTGLPTTLTRPHRVLKKDIIQVVQIPVAVVSESTAKVSRRKLVKE